LKYPRAGPHGTGRVAKLHVAILDREDGYVCDASDAQ
jgi:hypothetical protein